MKAALLALALLSFATAAQATVRIADDRGGRIGTYVDKYQGLRTSGEEVMIDGLCASACTIVLGAVAHDRICVTDRASLGFHAAYDFESDGRKVTNPDATQMLFSMYPAKVRRWIVSRGGLTPTMMFLRGAQLSAMYRRCGDETRQAKRLPKPLQPSDQGVAAASASVEAPAQPASTAWSWSGIDWRGLGDLIGGR